MSCVPQSNDVTANMPLFFLAPLPTLYALAFVSTLSSRAEAGPVLVTGTILNVGDGVFTPVMLNPYLGKAMQASRWRKSDGDSDGDDDSDADSGRFPSSGRHNSTVELDTVSSDLQIKHDKSLFCKAVPAAGPAASIAGLLGAMPAAASADQQHW